MGIARIDATIEEMEAIAGLAPHGSGRDGGRRGTAPHESDVPSIAWPVRVVKSRTGRGAAAQIASRAKAGGRTRTRTLDPLIKSQLLYQLSYAPFASP
jgi:hypothetical protein